MAKLAFSTLFPILGLLLLFFATLTLSYNIDREKCESQCRQEEPSKQRERCMLRCRQQSRNNPFFFDEESFRTVVKAPEGNCKILERFSQQSNLLRGVENYRLAVFEAHPNTAVVPKHVDAESILFVAAGSATITLLRNENRATHNLRRGDILKVHAGTTVYLINNDNNEKLFIVELFETISTPGRVQAFFGIGGQNQESFLMRFSRDILEAAFNTQFEKVRRVFGDNRDFPFLKVSQEKIREIKQQASSSSQGSHGQWSRGPFNLFQKKPTYYNEHGRIYEIDSNDYQPLHDQDISISFAGIRRGSMVAPNYNSKATKVAVVIDGRGYLEIVSPSLSGQRGEQQREEEESSVSYQRLSAEVSKGNVYVVPTGYPYVITADKDQELLVVCFEINAENNERKTLAGQDTILHKMTTAEREMFFGESAKELEQILNAQKKAGLFEGPQRRRESQSKGRSDK